MNEIKQELIQSEDILIAELYEHGSHRAKQKDKYSCVHCSSSDALSIYKNSKNNYCYKCFSCNETGNVIDLIMKLDNIAFPKAIEYLCSKHNIPYAKAKSNTVTGIDKGKVIEFHEEKFQEAIGQGDQVTALRVLREKEEQEQTSYFVHFPYVETKKNGDVTPKKIWENVEAVVDHVGYKVVLNVITKQLEILGSEAEDINDQMMDIHSACHKCGLPLGLNAVNSFVNRIGAKNKINPVKDYLELCEFNYNGGDEIEKVCGSLMTPEYFPQELKRTLVVKWLLNTANIVYNEGCSNTEGCLVLQGKQKDGKTTWIRRLIPAEFLKTGLSLDPASIDSVRQATKYWVVELGELGSTMKNEQSRLKAFMTEPVDEYRVPYAINSKRFNRTTSFFGTVNEANFLKDVTGDRRFWVIPIDGIDRDLINSVNREQLWGQVMTMLPENLNNLELSDDEMEMLNESNDQFRVKGATQIAVEAGFAWNSPEETWVFMQPAEIAKKLGLKSTTGIKEAIESCGGKWTRQRVNGKQPRGFIVPPFISVD